MSTAHRSLARLPLDVYTDLILERTYNDVGDTSPEELRRQICSKLKKFPSRNSHKRSGTVVYESITTVGQLLTRISKLSLLHVLDPLLTYEEIDLLLHRVATTCAPPPQNALQLLHQTDKLEEIHTGQVTQQQITPAFSPQLQLQLQLQELPPMEHPWNRLRHLPTGVSLLDRCLRGGLRVGTITELAGRSGAGKTQLAMQLCVMAARYQQGCIYMDTERKLSLERLQEIAEQKRGTGNNNGIADIQNNDTNLPYPTARQVLDNVTILKPNTMQDLMSSLLEVEELVLSRNEDAMETTTTAAAAAGEHHQQPTTTPTSATQSTTTTFPVRLLIIDSIAAPTKKGGESAPERAAALFQCAQRLKQLADQLQLAILVINQVTLERRTSSANENTSSNNLEDLQHGGIKVGVKAALGTSWHHCVSTRIMMEQSPLGQLNNHNDPNNYGGMQQQQQQMGNHFVTSEKTAPRIATIVKSNLVGLQSVHYEIVGSGVVDAAVDNNDETLM